MSKKNADGTKKKPKTGLIIVIVIVCVLLIVGVVYCVMGITKATKDIMSSVNDSDNGTYKVEKIDISQEVITSGTVIGTDTIAYTSPVTAKVETVCVEVGQIVKKGDILLKYDTAELGDNLKKVQIQARSEKAAGNVSYEVANKAKAKANEAKTKIATLNGEIDKIKAEIERLKGIISQYESQNTPDVNVNTEEDMQDTEDTDKKKDDKKKDDKKEDAPVENPNRIDETTYQQALASLEAQNASLMEKQAEIEQLNGVIAAADEAAVSNSAATQISASNELIDMNVNDAQESVDQAEAGLVATKDGVVLSVDVMEGAYANETQTVFTIASLDSIGVEFTISKDALTSISEGQKARAVIGGKEYKGTVQFVSRVAESDALFANSNSANAVIKGRIVLDDPDDDIFIGVSAKTYIFIGEVKDALGIPYEALNSDVDGDYVYIVNKENLIERKDIITGICSDEYYEVVEGISEGDKVITEVTKDMKPGDEYVPTPAVANMMMP